MYTVYACRWSAHKITVCTRPNVRHSHHHQIHGGNCALRLCRCTMPCMLWPYDAHTFSSVSGSATICLSCICNCNIMGQIRILSLLIWLQNRMEACIESEQCVLCNSVGACRNRTSTITTMMVYCDLLSVFFFSLLKSTLLAHNPAWNGSTSTMNINRDARAYNGIEDKTQETVRTETIVYVSGDAPHDGVRII